MQGYHDWSLPELPSIKQALRSAALNSGILSNSMRYKATVVHCFSWMDSFLQCLDLDLFIF